MSIFSDLAKVVVDAVSKNKKTTMLTNDNLGYLLKIQSEGLNQLISSLSVFSPTEANSLLKKYLQIRFNQSDKNNVGYIVPALLRQYKGKALVAERKSFFGATIDTARIFLRLNEELQRNLGSFTKEAGVILYETKLSTVMLLGILREIDFFINYCSYLWGHVTDSISRSKFVPIGYQAKYLKDGLEKYITIVNDVCNKESTYSFIRSINEIKKKHADLLLYANGQSFLDFLDPSAYGSTEQRQLQNGIIGFNIVAYIVERIDEYKHCVYMKNKLYKEWLENKIALMRYDLMNVSPDSPEYQKILKRIEAYDAEIAKYDKKLREYEEEG